MYVTELKNEGLDFHVKIIIPNSIISDAINEKLVNLSKNAKHDGFRVGKVPNHIISQKYKLSVRKDVIDYQIDYNIQNIINENKLKIIDDPQLEDVQDEEGKDLEFVVKFELVPEIHMPDFKKILIERPKVIVQDCDIDKQIKKLGELSKVYIKESNKKIKNGDQVTIDAIGYVNNQPFEGGKVEDYKLVVGSKAFIEGFEDQLIGYKTGNEVEVRVTFPEEYPIKDVVGKQANFTVNIKSVHLAEEPIINDEFAKKFNSETLEELRTHIAKNMEFEFAESIYTIMKMKLFNQLEDLLTFDVPKSLLLQEERNLKSQARENSDALKALFQDKSEEEIEKYYNKLALRRVRVGLMLAEYMKVKDLKVDPNDIKGAIIAQAKKFPGQENKVFEFYKKNPKALVPLRGPLLEDKAVRNIFDNEVTVTEIIYTPEELKEFLSKEEYVTM